MVGVGSRGVGWGLLGDGEVDRAQTSRAAYWGPKASNLSFWAGSEVVDFGCWVGVGSWGALGRRLRQALAKRSLDLRACRSGKIWRT